MFDPITDPADRSIRIRQTHLEQMVIAKLTANGRISGLTSEKEVKSLASYPSQRMFFPDVLEMDKAQEKIAYRVMIENALSSAKSLKKSASMQWTSGPKHVPDLFADCTRVLRGGGERRESPG